jgi:hypothetical protein
MTLISTYIASFLAAALFAVAAVSSHAEPERKVLTMADYGLWRVVSSAALSNDGYWMDYDYRKPEAANPFLIIEQDEPFVPSKGWAENCRYVQMGD